MTEERALKIGLNLQNIGYQVDDETLKKIKPFKDAIEAEILEEIEDDKRASAEAYNEATEDAIKQVKAYFIEIIENAPKMNLSECDRVAFIPNKKICERLKALKKGADNGKN